MKTRNILMIIPALLGIVLGGCNVSSDENEPTPETIQDFTSATFNDATYVYDGNPHQLAVVSGVPSDTSITYEGRDRYVNVGEYPATATLSKKGYNTKTLSAKLTITPASFNNIVFQDQSVEYNGSQHSIVCSNVPSFASVTYQNNKGTEVGTYNATATITAPNYNPLTLHATLTITKGNIKGVTFNNTSYTYDGSEKTITVSGTIPTGVSVNYVNNRRTDAGSQEATATLTGEGYNTLYLHATLTINKAVFTGITFSDLTVDYDGNVHTITASGVPAGASVVYENNSASQGGVYNATATISAPNYETLVLHATLTIALKQFVGITFNDQTYEYNGNQFNIQLSGTLPVGSNVVYEGNGKSEVGEYTVTATITCEGYETLVLTATMTITARKITGVTFNDATFDYDGEQHTILITGTLPEGVTASYSNNTRTEKGYQYATVTLSGTGYETLNLEAILTIADPNEDRIYTSSEDNILVSTAELSSGTGTLTTDRGTSVGFAYANAKAGNSGDWLALGIGGYFYNTTPVNSFSDLSLQFSEGYEKFNVYYSFDEPVFDNAHKVELTASYSGFKSIEVIYNEQPSYFKIESRETIYDVRIEEMYVHIDTSIVHPTLTVTSNSSYGTVSGGGKYKAGNKVTVQATPKSSTYVFDSWQIDNKVVSLQSSYTFTMPSEDLSITGVFVTKSQHNWDLAHGVRPDIDLTNNVVTYGMYPQTHIKNQSLITALNNIDEPEANGWYLFNDDYYAKVVATPHVFSSSYIPEFNDGTEILEGETYWFKVDPIEWSKRRTNYTDGSYYLLSKYLLDAQMFYSSKDTRTIEGNTIYANNYEHSDIRAWLNNEFYSKAFSLDNSCVGLTTVNNSKSTTNDSKYNWYCNNTQDYVYLPSYNELFINHGFSGDESRMAFTTDYSRAVGACYIEINDEERDFVKFTAQYWERSPDNSLWGFDYTICVVKHGGFVGDLAHSRVDDGSVLVRPVISFINI